MTGGRSVEQPAPTSPPSTPPALHPATLRRRLASLAYEALVLTAVLIVAGFAVLPLMPDPAGIGERTLHAPGPLGRTISLGWSLVVSAGYFGWFWSEGRRTLPMKTWRLTLATVTGAPVRYPRALRRFVASLVGPASAVVAYAVLAPLGHARWAFALAGVNFAWALWDRDGDFLHDRLAGTRLFHERGQ